MEKRDIDANVLAYYEKMLVQLTELAPADPDRDELRREVIEGYLPLASRLAGRYARRGERSDDLIQVARLALVKAVDGFKPALGSFTGYAVPTIQGELKRYFRDQCWDVRVPRRLQELRIQVNSSSARLSQSLGHSPSATEIADDVGCSETQVAEAASAAQAYNVASLNVPTGESGEGCELQELIGGADEHVEEIPDRLSLGPALRRLPERELSLLRMRFVDNLTQAQIAERMGLSQMHVSRLLTRTLHALRDWIDGVTDEVVVCAERRHLEAGRATA